MKTVAGYALDSHLLGSIQEALVRSLDANDIQAITAGLYGSVVGRNNMIEHCADVDLFLAVTELTPTLWAKVQRAIRIAVPPRMQLIYANGPIFHRSTIARRPTVHVVLHDLKTAPSARGLYGNNLLMADGAVGDLRAVLPWKGVTPEVLSHDPHGLLASVEMLRKRIVPYNTWVVTTDDVRLSDRCDEIPATRSNALVSYVWRHMRRHLVQWERTSGARVVDWNKVSSILASHRLVDTPGHCQRTLDDLADELEAVAECLRKC